MSYCHTTNVITRLDHLSDSITEDFISLAVEDADEWIKSKIDENSLPSTVPTGVEKAAEYYAAATILHGLYDTDGTESAVALRYEKRAEELLDSYINSNTSIAETHPYSHSRTPGDTFIQRDETLDIEEESEDMREVLDGESDAWSP